MIKERDLEPGRVLTRKERIFSNGKSADWITVWMVVGFQAHISRRHNHSTAPRDGWDVVMIQMGNDGTTSPINVFNITPRSMGEWKRQF